MECPSCKKNNDDTSVYCLYCGKELKEPEKVIIENVNQTRVNPFALSGFIVSIVSSFLSTMFLAGITGTVSIVLSAIGISQTNKGKGKGKPFAMVGLFLGISALSYSMIKIVAFLVLKFFD